MLGRSKEAMNWGAPCSPNTRRMSARAVVGGGGEGDGSTFQQVEGTGEEQALGRDIQQVKFPSEQGRLHLAHPCGTEGGIEKGSPHPELLQRIHLILHQGDQRRHHDAHAISEERRHLITQALATARRHQDQGVSSSVTARTISACRTSRARWSVWLGNREGVMAPQDRAFCCGRNGESLLRSAPQNPSCACSSAIVRQVVVALPAVELAAVPEPLSWPKTFALTLRFRSTTFQPRCVFTATSTGRLLSPGMFSSPAQLTVPRSSVVPSA